MYGTTPLVPQIVKIMPAYTVGYIVKSTNSRIPQLKLSHAELSILFCKCTACTTYKAGDGKLQDVTLPHTGLPSNTTHAIHIIHTVHYKGPEGRQQYSYTY